MSFVDKFVAEMLALQVSLFHSCARLEARTDSEALHDLRVVIRRMRSLLRPVRSMRGIVELNNAARVVGELTSPARDLEVLIQELERRALAGPAQLRKALLESSYFKILHSPSLYKLFVELDGFPRVFRSLELNGDLKRLESSIERVLKKQISRLYEAINDAGVNRHKLRILVKEVRYLMEAFPQRISLLDEVISSLKALQSALGDWHDHYQWCQKALTQSDLRPLERIWQRSTALALKKADIQLLDLIMYLPRLSGMKLSKGVVGQSRH